MARKARTESDAEVPAHLVKLVKRAEPGPKRRGPKTPEGRAAVRMNALRHGIESSVVPIPSEDEAAWLAFRQSVIDDRAPEGVLEEELAARIAEMLWRLRRVPRYEREAIASSQQRVAEDYADRWKWHDRPASIEIIEGAEAGLREARSVVGLRGEPWRELSESAAAVLVEVLTDGDDDLKDLPMPGSDETLEDTIESTRTVGSVLAAIAFLAQHLEMPEQTFIENLIARMDVMEERYGRDRAQLLDERDRMHRERVLPPEKSLLNVIKYEAHLNRQLMQAMHELEALQARRAGHLAPLARVQISAGA